MQTASRESFAAALERLNEVAARARAGTLDKIGDELLAVAGLLGSEPGLRRALANPSRTAEDRSALANAVLGKRVNARTVELVRLLAGGRWSSTTDLLDAVELLGVQSLLAEAERAGTLADVEDALFRFRQLVAGQPQLASVLGDSTAGTAPRAELVAQLLTGKVEAVVVRLAQVAVAGFGGRTFEGALTRLLELAAARRDRQLAYVTVAVALAEEDEERLAATLARRYGREISVRLSVDPAVLGGVRVRVDHDLYDGTVQRRLDDARKALVGRR